MSHGVTCPECGKTYDTPRGFLSHWGHADDDTHSGPAPKEAYGELEFSEEHRENISESRSGIPHSEETKRQISETMQGMEAWSKGLTKEEDERVMNRAKALEGHSKHPEVIEDHRERIKSLWEQGHYDDRADTAHYGEENYFYKHGEYRQHPDYPEEFDEDLRKQIRERDNHVCQHCGDSPDHRLHVHHIDADKENNDPNNLIALCSRCHKMMEYRSEIVQRLAYSTGPNPTWELSERVVM